MFVFVMLTVPPYFRTCPPPNLTATQGEDLNLTCAAYGDPSPHVSWLQDEENLPQAEPPDKPQGPENDKPEEQQDFFQQGEPKQEEE